MIYKCHFVICFLLWMLNSSSATCAHKKDNPNESQLDEQCGYYAYKTMKSLLTYVKQLKDENESNKSGEKDQEIKDLKQKVHALELKLAENAHKDDLINLYKLVALKDAEVIEKLTNTSFSIRNDIKQLAEKETESLKRQMVNQTNIINEQNQLIAELKKTLQSRLDENKGLLTQIQQKGTQVEVLLKQSEDYKLEIDKLEKFIDNNVPNGCVSNKNTTGKLLIESSNSGSFEVMCDNEIAGGGWTVIRQTVPELRSFPLIVTSDTGYNYTGVGYFLGYKKIIHLLNRSYKHFEAIITLTTSKGTEICAHFENFTAVQISKTSWKIRVANSTMQSKRFFTKPITWFDNCVTGTAYRCFENMSDGKLVRVLIRPKNSKEI